MAQPQVRFTTYLRLIVVVVVAYGLAIVGPDYLPWAGTSPLLAMITVLIGAITLAVLLSYSLTRRQQLFEAVRLELNKIRRVYHVAKNLAAASNEFRPWFTDLHGFVYQYLSLYGQKNWQRDQNDFNTAFRKMSYHIYTVPELKGHKEEMLYEDLLHSTGTVAEARQKIIELFEGGFTRYAWLAMSITTAGSVMAVLMSLGPDSGNRFVGGTVLAAVLILLDIVGKVDALAAERQYLSRRYVQNIARLELKRD